MWRGRLARGSVKQFAVGSHSDQLQDFSIRLAVNEQQVWPQVALAMIAPASGQTVIAILFWQRFVLREQAHGVSEN